MVEDAAMGECHNREIGDACRNRNPQGEGREVDGLP